MCSNFPFTPDTWKGQLDFKSACTATAPEQRCWLIRKLPAWNKVLHRLNYRLSEPTPGKLGLRYHQSLVLNEPRMVAGAFLISWLVGNHRCIDELRILCTVFPDNFTSDQAPAALRLRLSPGNSIRRLEIAMKPAGAYSGTNSYYLLDKDIDALQGVEELHIHACSTTLQSGGIKLLRNKSLRSVEVSASEISWSMLDALQRLDKCESMSLSSFTVSDDTLSETDTLISLMRSSGPVKKLRVLGQKGEQWNFSAIADALAANKTLTTLDLSVPCSVSPRDFFAALELNASVKTLCVSFTRIGADCGQPLASALHKNSCLLELRLCGYVDNICLIRIGEALSHNVTLEELGFRSWYAGVTGILALCDALRTNKTLKKLFLPNLIASKAERRALAEKLAHDDAYSRVVLPDLMDCDLPALSNLLSSPRLCPEEISKIDIFKVSDTNLKLIFDCLASCGNVKRLNVCIDGYSQEKVEALNAMLKKNHSISGIRIEIKRGGGPIVRQLLKALQDTKNISELRISFEVIESESVSVLLDFLTRNRTFTAFRLQMRGKIIAVQTAEDLSWKIPMNPVIFRYSNSRGVYPWEAIRLPVLENLERNRSLLNRAVDFILLHDMDRQSAEAFELFSGTPCLLDHVVQISGQTEREALQAIAAAENALRDNYFVITGIVRRSVVCHRANNGGTQIDELKADCWRAIACHLKISDVAG